jgi:hypothetical protein
MMIQFSLFIHEILSVELRVSGEITNFLSCFLSIVVFLKISGSMGVMIKILNVWRKLIDE